MLRQSAIRHCRDCDFLIHNSNFYFSVLIFLKICIISGYHNSTTLDYGFRHFLARGVVYSCECGARNIHQFCSLTLLQLFIIHKTNSLVFIIIHFDWIGSTLRQTDRSKRTNRWSRHDNTALLRSRHNLITDYEAKDTTFL